MNYDLRERENKTQYCSIRIILGETVTLKGNRQYFVRGAVDCEEFYVNFAFFVGYKDKLAAIYVLSGNAIVYVDSEGKTPVRLYNF